jgi:hypothetical protein
MKRIMGFVFIFSFLMAFQPANAEYYDNGDGTISDTSTGLMWLSSVVGGNWDEANSYCNITSVGGYTDWRLPTLSELENLMDPSFSPYSCIDPIFPRKGGYYLTSTVDGDSAWGVSFFYCSVALREKRSYNVGMCVRGGSAPPTPPEPTQYDITGIWQVVGQAYYFSLYVKDSSVIVITFVPGAGESYMLGTISGNSGHINQASDLSQFDATFEATSDSTGTLTVNNCVPFPGEYCLLPVGSTFNVQRIF